jgi:hypothetical protein
MDVMIEERLQALYDSAKGGAEMPTEIFRRLHFLAHVLREGPKADGSGVRLLWISEHGGVEAATVGDVALVVGRDPSSDVVLPSPRVSRKHCRILPVPHGFRAVAIEDLGSSNGTFVNGVRLGERVQRLLRDGDVIEVGGIALAVAVTSAN